MWLLRYFTISLGVTKVLGPVDFVPILSLHIVIDSSRFNIIRLWCFEKPKEIATYLNNHIGKLTYYKTECVSKCLENSLVYLNYTSSENRKIFNLMKNVFSVTKKHERSLHGRNCCGLRNSYCGRNFHSNVLTCHEILLPFENHVNIKRKWFPVITSWKISENNKIHQKIDFFGDESKFRWMGCARNYARAHITT